MDTGELFEGPTTPDLEWPTWIVYSAVPLGSYLMCFRFLQVCVGFIRRGELPQHDHGHVEGVEEEGPPKPGEEDLIFRMEDDMHPRDLRSGADRRQTEGSSPTGAERRSGGDRRQGSPDRRHADSEGRQP
jgi:C4-dicarboxylate transporter DctQ subunit